MGAPDRTDGDLSYAPAATGALAAGLLEGSCRAALGSRGSLYLEVVRDMALDLGWRLDVLAKPRDVVPADLLAEAAVQCADLANLAACAVPNLPAENAPAAVAAVHLAAGAVRALLPLVENGVGTPDEDKAGYAVRDARGAAWRADLAARQVDGLRTETQGKP